MTRYVFDLYPRDDPGAGTRLVRFSQLQSAEYRREANGTGVGKLSLRGTSTDAAFIDPAGLQYVRVVLVKNDLSEVTYGGFFLENGDFAALNKKSDKLLTFTGAGSLSVLQRAIAAEESYLSADDPVDGEWRWSTQTAGEILDRMLREAQAAGRPQDPLSMVTHDFDGDVDSAAVAWAITDVDFRFQVGRDLLDLVRQFMAKGLQVDMDGDFLLHAWQTRGTDRTGVAWGAGVVRFQSPTDGTIATGNILSDAKRGLSAFVQRSNILIGNPELGYAWVPGSVGGPGLQDIDWEGFIPDVSDPNSTASTAVSEAQLAARDDAGDTVRLRIRLGESPTTGAYTPGLHFDVADLVTLHTGSDTWDWDETEQTVAAITLILRDARNWDALVDLGSQYSSIESRAFSNVPVGAHSHGPNPQLCQPFTADTVLRFYRMGDTPAGDPFTSSWPDFAENQCGAPGTGAEGTSCGAFVAGSAWVSQHSMAASPGSTYRVEGWTKQASTRHLLFCFYDIGPYTSTSIGDTTLVDNRIGTPTTLHNAVTSVWTPFTADIVAPAGTLSMGLAVTGSGGLSADEITITLLGTGPEGACPADLGDECEVGTEGSAARCDHVHAHGHLDGAGPYHDADAITFTPTGSIAATNVQAAIAEVGSEGAPPGADYLVGTAQAGLSAEIPVGTTPGGELGGTWASPTVDATHAGSTHSAAADTHAADASDAHDAAAISFVPNGSITATDVQAAIVEVRDEAAGGGAHAASHEDGGADEIDVTGLVGAGAPADILDIPTAETDDTLVLAPDGAGGVEFRAEAGGGGSPSRLAYDDQCDVSGLPTGASSSGTLTYDSTQLRRELGGVAASTYVSAGVPLNGSLLIEVVMESLNAVSAGNSLSISVRRKTSGVVLANWSIQDDRNEVLYIEGTARANTGIGNVGSTDRTMRRAAFFVTEQKQIGGSISPPYGMWEGGALNSGNTKAAGANFLGTGTLNAGDDIEVVVATVGTRLCAIYLVRIWRGAIAA